MGRPGLTPSPYTEFPPPSLPAQSAMSERPTEYAVAYVAGPDPEPVDPSTSGRLTVPLPGLGSLLVFRDTRRGGRWGWTFRPQVQGPAAQHATADEALAEARRTVAARLRAAADALAPR